MMAAGTSQDPGCHLFPEGAETSNLSLHRSKDLVIPASQPAIMLTRVRQVRLRVGTKEADAPGCCHQ